MQLTAESPLSSSRRHPIGGGGCATIRPARDADRETYVAAVAALSPLSRFQRFFGPKPRLPESDVRRLMDLDPARQAVWFAIADADGSGLGAARYAIVAPRVAEVAVAVLDDYHGIGLGGALFDEVITGAGAHGLRTLLAETLEDNRAARGMLSNRGFRAVGVRRGVVSWQLELASETESRPEPGE